MRAQKSGCLPRLLHPRDHTQRTRTYTLIAVEFLLAGGMYCAWVRRLNCTGKRALGKKRRKKKKKKGEKKKKKLLAYKIIVLVVVEVGVAVLCVEQEHLRLAEASEGKEGTGGSHRYCRRKNYGKCR